MPADRDVFVALTALVLERQAGPEDMERFRELLRAHPEFIELYRRQVMMVTLLSVKPVWDRELNAGQADATERVPPAAAVPAVSVAVGATGTAGAAGRRMSVRFRKVAAFAATVALVATGLWLAAGGGGSAAAIMPVVGRRSPVEIIHRWGSCKLEVPETLPGTLRMTNGRITARLSSGIELVLLGPFELEIRTPMEAKLLSGRLLAEVSKSASGFMLYTPDFEMWDIGTLFGVTVTEEGSDVFVFKGEVQVNEACGEPVDICRAGEGARARRDGSGAVKIAANTPDAERLLAAATARDVLKDPEDAFYAIRRISDIWAAEWMPKVVEAPKPMPGLRDDMQSAIGNRQAGAGIMDPASAHVQISGKTQQEDNEMNGTVKMMASAALGIAVLGTPVIANAQVVIDDPVAYWSFEGVGGVLSNLVTSGLYHDATVLKGQPAAGIAAGGAAVVGNAMVLDGASGIRLPYHQDNLGRSFTISLWYWQSTNDTRQCVYQSRDNFVASYEADNNARSNFISHAGQEWVAGVITGLKEWTHLTHTFSTVGNTTTFSVYTNGALRITTSVAAANVFEVNQLRGLHVGVNRDLTIENGRPFKGMIDELALWNRALTAAEVLAVYERGAGGEELEFTERTAPRLSLASGQLEFSVQADDGILGGMFNNGWLLNGGTVLPGHAPDTAGDADAALGRVSDTAGHADGPFHALVTDLKWRVPMTDTLRDLSQTNFTVEAWFRTTDTGNNILFGNYDPSFPGVVNLELESSNQIKLYLQNGAGEVNVNRLRVSLGSVVTRDGRWHHLAGIRRDNFIYLYLDGVERGSMAASLGPYTLGGHNCYLGRDTRGTSYGLFNGEIGQTRLWTRALSAAEVAAIAAFGKPGVGSISRDNLLAAYDLSNSFTAMSVAPQGYQIAATPQMRQLTQTNFTYEVKFRTTDTGRGILVGNYVDAKTTIISSLELFTDNEIRFIQAVGASWVSLTRSAGAVNTRDGAWHRIAAVRRDGQACLYLDGQQLGAAINDTLGSYVLLGSYLGLGRDFRDPLLPFNGDLAEVRIWDRALSAAEVADLAASGTVPQPGLFAEYAPIPTNSLRTAGFPGDSFLRSWAAGTNSSAMVFEGLPRHNKVGLGLLLAQLDSLDPLLGGDRFVIKVDGAEVLSVGLGPDQGGEPQVSDFKLFGVAADVEVFKNTLTLGGQDLFSGGTGIVYNDHVYDLSLLEALQSIPHTGEQLVVEFLGIHDAGGENEGFGIDDIRLTVHPPQGTVLSLQ